jgi:hypothetical protein
LEDQWPRVLAALVGWVLLVWLLFRWLGPRRATLVAVIGGYAVLPSVYLETPLPGPIGFGKPDAIAIGLVLGIVCFDRSTLRRARPHRLDLPMLLFAAYPLTGFLTDGRAAPGDIADMIVQRGLGWLVPYVAARLYFSDGEGARRIGIAVVVAALLLVPVAAFETVMGPHWYLGGLIYGLRYQPTMVERLGGWRPEGFFGNGIHFATWMALGAVTSFWLWIGGAWRPRRGPSWWPTLVLVLASIACRGIYGYVTLGLGLASASLTRGLRTRGVLVALALVAPIYIGVRASGLWDASSLARLSAFTGRASSVGFRVQAEDSVMASVLSTHPALGFGVHIWHFEAVRATFTHWPDGWWLCTLWESGLAGLVLLLLAIHLLPAGLALSRPRGRPDRREAGSPSWGLALFTILFLIDGLHNQSPLIPAALVAGALTGQAVRRLRAPNDGPARGDAEQGSRTYSFHRDPRPTGTPAGNPFVRNMLRLLFVLLLLATPELLDAATRFFRDRPDAPSDHPITPAADRPE